MSAANKCRAADDLGVVVCHHAAPNRERVELVGMPVRELLTIAAEASSLPVRALGLWYAIGTARRPYGELLPRRGDPKGVFDWMCETGYPHSLVETARDNYRVTGETLGLLLVLLWRERGETPVPTADDEFPAGAGYGLNTWARDGFSHEGRRALASFLRVDCPSTRWVHQHIPSAERISFLGGILFRVEGSLVRQRILWQPAIELRRMAGVECNGPHCHDATEIMALLRADIPLLNEVRAYVR